MSKYITAKNYDSAYIYGLYNYGELLVKAINSGNRIDIKSKKAEDILYNIKQRQTTNVLYDFIQSPNVILLKLDKALPQAFNVFSAKDIKIDNKNKVFIDCTNTIEEKDGFYINKNINILVAQCVSAMTYLIYYADPSRLISNQSLIQDSTTAFVDLFCYILDYLKVSGYREYNGRIRFFVACYYLIGILWKDPTPNVYNIATKVSGLDTRKANIADMFLTNPKEQLKDINSFITFLSKACTLNDLTTEVFVDKFVYICGNGTQFAVEILPAFLKLITDTYSGTYIVRQKSIEKILGRQIITITNDIFNIGNAAHKK